MPFPRLDFLVPDDWQLAESDDSHAVFATPDGYLFSVVRGPAGDSDATEIMKELAAIQQSEILETRELDSAIFQGVIAPVRGPHGEVAVFYTTVARGLGIAAGWVSPGQETREEVFEEVLGTLEWKLSPGEMLVPGETIGDRTLQADLLNLILVSDPDCRETSVVYTKFI